MATQKIVLKTNTFENQRVKINEIGQDTYNILTGGVTVQSVSIGVSDEVVFIGTNSVNDTSNAEFVADTFVIADFRTTKYLVQVQETGSNNFYSTEVLLMHDGSIVHMTQYATLHTNTSPVDSIRSDVNGGNVRLLITPSVANTTTKISKISLVA